MASQDSTPLSGRTIFDFLYDNKKLAIIICIALIVAGAIYSGIIHNIAKPGKEVKLFFGLVSYTKKPLANVLVKKKQLNKSCQRVKRALLMLQKLKQKAIRLIKKQSKV